MTFEVFIKVVDGTRPVDTRSVKDRISMLERFNVRSVVLVGDNIGLHTDLRELVEKAKSVCRDVSVFTSGKYVDIRDVYDLKVVIPIRFWMPYEDQWYGETFGRNKQQLLTNTESIVWQTVDEDFSPTVRNVCEDNDISWMGFCKDIQSSNCIGMPYWMLFTSDMYRQTNLQIYDEEVMEMGYDIVGRMYINDEGYVYDHTGASQGHLSHMDHSDMRMVSPS